jgi:hypothetical protein
MGAKRKNLARLKFKNFQEYLESDLWRIIKEKVFNERGLMCLADGCCNNATTVHMRGCRLDTLRGDDLIDLLPVCLECFDKQGVTFKEAFKAWRQEHIKADPRRVFHAKKGNLRGNRRKITRSDAYKAKRYSWGN